MNDTQNTKRTALLSRHGTARRMGAILLALVMVCAAITGSAFAAETNGETSGLVFTSAENDEILSAAEVYVRNVNSTVGITTSITTNLFGYESTSAAAGSGFIITEDGYILTNYHVVEESQSITVTLYDNETYDAELIGYDDSNDVAVLKIDAEGLTPVIFGDSDELVVGQDVVAIGNPLGELTFSLTRGIISALGRDVTLSGSVRMKLIQTDCAINSGNSGGALFNMYGEVIGITNAKYSSSGYSASIDNIGFAIPVNSITGIVEQIMTTGSISTPYIGITIMNVSSDLKAYGIPDGADVQSVTEGSPADEAGIKKNDIIIEADGRTITGSDDLVTYVRSRSVGDEILLKIYRQGETLELTVVVGENVKSALPEPEPASESDAASGEMPSGSITIPNFDEFFGEDFFN